MRSSQRGAPLRAQARLETSSPTSQLGMPASQISWQPDFPQQPIPTQATGKWSNMPPAPPLTGKWAQPTPQYQPTLVSPPWEDHAASYAPQQPSLSTFSPDLTGKLAISQPLDPFSLGASSTPTRDPFSLGPLGAHMSSSKAPGANASEPSMKPFEKAAGTGLQQAPGSKAGPGPLRGGWGDR